MRVALVALQVRGAMGEYLELLARSVSKKAEVHVFAPSHFVFENLGDSTLHTFQTGATRKNALKNLIDPVRGYLVWRMIEETKPDVVHLFNGEGYPWAILWSKLANRARIPLGVTVHDPEVHPGNVWEKINAWTRTEVLRCASGVHLHSTVFGRSLSKVRLNSVVYIPHGSFAPLYLPYAKPDVPKENLALFFGRIEAYKGLNELVEAGLLLNGEVKIAIAGPGKIPYEVEQVVRMRKDIFELHNRFLSRSEVATLFQRSSVCVLPYRQATQSSIPLISAAFGVPVVATALGGFLQDVPRVNGILVKPGDPRSLAEGILVARSVTPHYPAELEFENLASRFLEWYHQLVGRSGYSTTNVAQDT